MNNDTTKSDTGIALTEYTIATALLIGIFIFASTAIYLSGKKRAESSVGTVRNAAPCIETSAVPGGSGCPSGQVENFDSTKCCYP